MLHERTTESQFPRLFECFLRLISFACAGKRISQHAPALSMRGPQRDNRLKLVCRCGPVMLLFQSYPIVEMDIRVPRTSLCRRTKRTVRFGPVLPCTLSDCHVVVRVSRVLHGGQGGPQCIDRGIDAS